VCFALTATRKALGALAASGALTSVRASSLASLSTVAQQDAEALSAVALRALLRSLRSLSKTPKHSLRSRSEPCFALYGRSARRRRSKFRRTLLRSAGRQVYSGRAVAVRSIGVGSCTVAPVPGRPANSLKPYNDATRFEQVEAEFPLHRAERSDTRAPIRHDRDRTPRTGWRLEHGRQLEWLARTSHTETALPPHRRRPHTSPNRFLRSLRSLSHPSRARSHTVARRAPEQGVPSLPQQPEGEDGRRVSPGSVFVSDRRTEPP
jgi:hypothetical protein